MRELRISSPAKINLILQVGECNTTGYHRVDTLMQSLDLCDELVFACEKHNVLAWENSQAVVDLSIEYDKSIISLFGQDFLQQAINREDNLITKAASLLAHHPKVVPCPVRCTLVKHIPLQAGLGGGSSNAAATLLALTELWDTCISQEELIALAAQLGCDVPFFLQGACAFYTGRGDKLKARFPSLRMPFVLVKPKASISTKAAYARFDELAENQRVSVQSSGISALEAALERVGTQDGFAPVDAKSLEWSNNLEEVAFSLEPSLRDLAFMLRSCAEGKRVLMSGSGSAFFIACDTEEEQQCIWESLRARWSSQDLWIVCAQALDAPVHFV